MRIGTRGSQLARWQADWVRDRLAANGVRAEIVVIRTQGDAEVDRPLHELEGTGFFTKEIEQALLDGGIDVAVHSLKDLPTRLPDGLVLAAVPPRHDPREALVNGTSLTDLPAGTRVGTSSLRRIAQVRFLRPDLEVVPLRGNVPTRVRKVESRDGLDVALLAIAGLERLGLGGKGAAIDPLDVMPAPGQGALGIEIRDDDKTTRKALQALHDPVSAAAVGAERTLLAELGGGCQAPVAAWVDGNRLYGRVTERDGASQLTASADLVPKRPGAAGEVVARLLLAEGAATLLAR
ncbi:MAG: hydroxymethylbilane synthase [Gemmatimonadetes bacterium]|nr:MAG: hydroxymethylbilane synthase [Gemmatimonadota bacterium]TMK66920.1 MAG: hydroxymethylbilane synthase [Actinomycetota bacterium]